MASPKQTSPLKCEMQMTAMIDVVFQLLIFFMLAFRIAVNEGDFHIKMPLAASNANPADDFNVPPLQVRLSSQGPQGVTITMNQQPVENFDALRERVIQVFGTGSDPGNQLAAAEVEFECDYDLPYHQVMRAVTAVSGFHDNGRVVKLVEKLKLAPARQTRN